MKMIGTRSFTYNQLDYVLCVEVEELWYIFTQYPKASKAPSLC